MKVPPLPPGYALIERLEQGELDRYLSRILHAVWSRIKIAEPGLPLPHHVEIVANRFECVQTCPAAGEHIHEYRANRVRPTAGQTATYRRLDGEAPTSG